MGHGRGVTLVELIVSMLIVSIIGLVAGRGLLLTLRVDRETRERSRVHENARRTVDALRRTCGNLMPLRVGEYGPYSEGVDPARDATLYRFVTRMPEHSLGGSIVESITGRVGPGDVEAIVMCYSLLPQDEGGMLLSRSRQYLGSGGLVGDPLEGVVSEGIRNFHVTPVFEEESGDSEGGNSGEGAVEVLVAFDVRVEYDLADDKPYLVAVQLPVGSRPDKKQIQ
jgi:prepilin-type N-terminal cleavage/methylation domain-containing protein